MEKLKKHKVLLIKLTLVGVVILCGILIFITPKLRGILTIVLSSFMLAYVLKPLKRSIARRLNVSEKKVALIMVLSILIFLILSVVVLIPLIFKELNNIVPTITSISTKIEEYFTKSSAYNSAFLRFIYEEGISKFNGLINGASEGFVDKLISFSENILSFAVVPVATYYFLADDYKIWQKVSLLIPIKKREVTKKIIKDINKLLESYILGQLLLSLIITVITLLALLIIRVKFAVALSVLNGIFNIIPYFGPIFGAIPVVIVALLDSPSKALWAAIAILIIQQIEGNILSPKITGQSTNMHPLVIIILLLVGESFGGFVGMILVVPIGVIIKVIYEDINYYLF